MRAAPHMRLAHQSGRPRSHQCPISCPPWAHAADHETLQKTSLSIFCSTILVRGAVWSRSFVEPHARDRPKKPDEPAPRHAPRDVGLSERAFILVLRLAVMDSLGSWRLYLFRMFLFFFAPSLWSPPVRIRLCLYGVRDGRASFQPAPLPTNKALRARLQ